MKYSFKNLVSLGLLFVVPAIAQAAQLTEVPLSSRLRVAVEELYQTTRLDMDRGGIKSITRYQLAEPAMTFQIVRSVVAKDFREGEMGGVLKRGCHESGTDDVTQCAREVLTLGTKGDVTEVLRHITESLPDADNDLQPRLSRQLNDIKNLISRSFPNGNDEYSFGYDDVATVKKSIMISADRKTVLVIVWNLGS